MNDQLFTIAKAWGPISRDEILQRYEGNKLVHDEAAQEYEASERASVTAALASEMLFRIHDGVDVADANQKAQAGAQVILQGKYIGSEPAGSAAEFLDFLAQTRLEIAR